MRSSTPAARRLGACTAPKPWVAASTVTVTHVAVLENDPRRGWRSYKAVTMRLVISRFARHRHRISSNSMRIRRGQPCARERSGTQSRVMPPVFGRRARPRFAFLAGIFQPPPPAISRLASLSSLIRPSRGGPRHNQLPKLILGVKFTDAFLAISRRQILTPVHNPG
jgi:hypothetical protein